MTSRAATEIPGSREELDRILCSRTFRDRETLQRLLEYLAQRTLNGKAADLKEYVVGIDVLGKPVGYDPQADASVRVQIGKLRRKLDEYYVDEGAEDTMLLRLPKRQFAVSFERRDAKLPLPPEPRDIPHRAVPWLRILPWALVFFFAGCALFLATRATGRAPTVSPELAEIWKPFLTGSRPVLMSLGTVQFYSYPTGYVREPSLDPLTDDQRQPRLQELRSLLHSSQPLKPFLVYTGAGEATAAFLFTKHFDRLNLPIDLVRSNVLSWDEIAQHNVIFLGGPKLNSHLLKIPAAWAFRVQGGQILNLQPKPGEASSYGDDHSVVSLLPGLHGQGEILIVESPNGTGVWAAAQFLTDPGYGKELLAHLRQPDGRLPRHYQVVLKNQILDGVPIRISYVAHRVL